MFVYDFESIAGGSGNNRRTAASLAANDSQNKGIEMNRKKWILSGLYLAISLVAFSLSMFKIDNPVWIAGWIAPVFLIRFMRDNKWILSIVLCFIALQIASFIGAIPRFEMMTASSVKMSFLFVLRMQLRSGAVFYVLSFLIPFIADKALHKSLPGFVSTLVYPSAVVAVELLFFWVYGAGYTFGDSLFSLAPLVMTASLFGIFGLSFMVAWFAPVINFLWEEDWDIQRVGYPGLVYPAIMVVMLLYGGIVSAFPSEPVKTVTMAGITIENGFFDRMAESELYVGELFNLSPAETVNLMSSPQSHLDEVRQKTLAAVDAGAEIIIWQEYALTLDSSVADSYLQEIQNLADQEDIYILASYIRVLNEAERNDQPMKNMSVLYTPEGNIGWEYAKAFPAPGYEEFMVESGTADIPYLDTPYGRIGQVICADMIYPQYIQQAAAKNIDLLLVPSYDTTFLTPLLTFSSAYRAVENGFTMVRITGDGYSAVIDPYYRVWAGQNFFEQGSMNFYANVPVVSRNTVYASIGYLFPYVVVLLLISLTVLAIARKAKER
jgi:apolipoprotein N-acyltransferase